MSRLPLMLLGLAGLIAVPFIGVPPYWLHIMIIILIWSFAYTGWSVMGRFGLVSLGHGAFMGIGAYGTALLWNHAGLDALGRHTSFDAARRRFRAADRVSLL